MTMNEEFILTEQTVYATAEMISTKVNELIDELRKASDAQYKTLLEAVSGGDVEAVGDAVMFREKIKACIAVLQTAAGIFYNI